MTKPMPKTLLTLRVSRVTNKIIGVFVVINKEFGEPGMYLRFAVAGRKPKVAGRTQMRIFRLLYIKYRTQMRIFRHSYIKYFTKIRYFCFILHVKRDLGCGLSGCPVLFPVYISERIQWITFKIKRLMELKGWRCNVVILFDKRYI